MKRIIPTTDGQLLTNILTTRSNHNSFR